MIVIDTTRPFEPFIDMTTALWKQIPPQLVCLNDIIWCQSDVSIEGMLQTIAADYQSYSGDPYPHFVVFNGQVYLSDGHHRVLVSIIRGCADIEARVLYVNPNPKSNNRKLAEYGIQEVSLDYSGYVSFPSK